MIDTVTRGPSGKGFAIAFVAISAAVTGLAAPVLAMFIDVENVHKVIVAMVVCGLLLIGAIVTATRGEPVRFAFLAVLLLLPFMATPVPPGRLNLSVFDVAMIILTVTLIAGNTRAVGGRTRLFPVNSVRISMLLLVPAVLFSRAPLLSLWTLFEIFSVYVFFLLCLEELHRTGGAERIFTMFALAILLVAVGVFVERLLNVNLSFRTANPNTVMQLAGLEIRRGAGFFQDPQKAAQFLGCGVTFLLMLLVRGRFVQAKVRWFLWLTVAVGIGAMAATVSRGAILASAAVCILFAIAFSRWTFPVKLLVFAGGAALIGAASLLGGADLWLRLAPVGLTERLATLETSLNERIYLWFLARDAFIEHPLTGVGLGAFRTYLFETRATSLYFTGGQANPWLYILDQPENGYLKVVYEGGVFASLACLVFIFDLFRRALRVMRSTDSGVNARSEVIACVAALLVFGITFTTLFTVADERNAVLPALIFAIICSHTLPVVHPRPEGRSNTR